MLLQVVEHMDLSVLDLVSMWNGETAGEAIRESLEMARYVERLGYTRYWFAEHHNAVWQASSAPELLIAYAASATTTIRVGSGGVMLPNHSALKVAENFRTLEAMHPGRIDLGIGRAPGTDGMTALALRRSRQALAVDDFPNQMEELLGFLSGSLPLDHPFRRIVPTPVTPTTPTIWMLGSSGYGAQFAAEHGLGMAFAHHISRDMAVPALQSYRRNFQPSPYLAAPRSILATSVFCADTDEQAEDVAALMDLFRQRLGRGAFTPPTIAEAHAYRRTMAERGVPSVARTHDLIGAVERVVPNLRALAEAAQADEIMVLTFATDPIARRHSYDLLAEAFALQPTLQPA